MADIEVVEFFDTSHLTKKQVKNLKFAKKLDKGSLLDSYREIMLAGYFHLQIAKILEDGWDLVIIVDFEKVIKYKGELSDVNYLLSKLFLLTRGRICSFYEESLLKMMLLYDSEIENRRVFPPEYGL
jgi:hypothetical protein